MIRDYRHLTFLIFLFNTYDLVLYGQVKSDLKADVIIEKYFEKIGGEKWLNLSTRKEYAFVEYEVDRNSIIPTKSYDRIKVNSKSKGYVDVHKYLSTLKNTVMAIDSDCSWYYSSSSQTVHFFGAEPIKFKNKLPRTELMEVFNLEPMKRVFNEDTLYRVDFKDSRQLNGKQSLFFGKNSGLLFKRSFMSKDNVLWEYHFSNYTESEGFYEPYTIKLTSNGEAYFEIAVDSIKYNIEIDSTVFDPPIPCRNYSYSQHLETSYIIRLD